MADGSFDQVGSPLSFHVDRPTDTPTPPKHSVVLYDRRVSSIPKRLFNRLQGSNAPPLRRQLRRYTSVIKTLVDDAFYADRDKKSKRRNVLWALARAHAVILVFSEEDDRLLGCMVGNIRYHFSGCNVFVDDVITAPPLKRNGIQSKMMDEMIAFAKREGLERVTLYTENGNVAAKKSYQKKGFAVRGDTIVMVLDL